MTFDQAYKEWLTDELNKKVHAINKNINVKSFEDSAYHVLYKRPNAVCLVMNGGNASHSVVDGVDQNVMPCTVSIVCRSEFKTAVMNAMNALQTEYNAVKMSLTYYDQVTKSERSVYCKSTFNTLFEVTEADTPTRRSTVKAVYMQMSVSIIYGMNAVLMPDTFQLLIYNESNLKTYVFDIKHIESCNFASQPSYDEFVAQGEDRTHRNSLICNNSWNFSIYKVDGDVLQAIFNSELNGGYGLSGKQIMLRRISNDNETEEVKITFFSLTESYANNAAAYNLTLGY